MSAVLPPSTRRPRRGPYESLYHRIVANIHEPENEQACWVWKRQCDRWGYPRMNVYCAQRKRTVKVMVHITLYELLVGPIPKGLQLDHLCTVPPCINPDHVPPVTGSVNCLRRDARRKLA